MMIPPLNTWTSSGGIINNTFFFLIGSVRELPKLPDVKLKSTQYLPYIKRCHLWTTLLFLCKETGTQKCQSPLPSRTTWVELVGFPVLKRGLSHDLPTPNSGSHNTKKWDSEVDRSTTSMWLPKSYAGAPSPLTSTFSQWELDYQAMSHFILSSPLGGGGSEK